MNEKNSQRKLLERNRGRRGAGRRMRRAASALQRVLMYVPVGTKLSLSRDELYFLLWQVGIREDDGPEVALEIERLVSRFEFEERSSGGVRRPELLLALVFGAPVPVGTQFLGQARDLAALSAVAGSQSVLIDLETIAQAPELGVNELVAIGYGHMTVSQAAELLKVSRVHVLYAIDRGQLKTKASPNGTLVAVFSIRNYMNERIATGKTRESK